MNPPLAENAPASDAIRAEINQTRHRMDDTIGALGERFKGRHLMDEALHIFRTQTQNGNMNKFKDTLTRSANSAVHSVIDTVKTNPVPLALVGAGVAYYLYNRSQSMALRRDLSEADYRDYRYSPQDENSFGWDGSGQGNQANRPSSTENQNSPEGTAGTSPGLGENIREMGNEVRDKANAAVEGTREMGTRVAQRSRELYRHGREVAASTIEEHPLQAGLVCLAIGLLAGIALPTSEKVRGKVRPQARELRRRANSLVDSGRQVIRSAAEAAREEARSQGLTLDSLKAKATTVSRVATDAAENTGREQGQSAAAPSGATVASSSEI